MFGKGKGKGKGGGAGRGGRGGRGGRSGPGLALDEFTTAIAASAPSASPPGGSFDDALHVVLTSERPATEEECLQYCNAVWAVLSLASDDTDKGKLLVLALIRRRFHSKAPAAKETLAAAQGVAEESTGDGERILFYLAVRVVCKAAQSGIPFAAIPSSIFLAYFFSCCSVARVASPQIFVWFGGSPGVPCSFQV